MTKQQITWLLIRVAGVYFAYCAIFSLVPLAVSVPDLFTLPKIDRKGESEVPFNPARPMPEIGKPAPTPEMTKEEKDAERAYRIQSLQNFFWYLGITLFYCFGAWYLIRDGRVIFDALNREEPFGISRGDGEVTALNLLEKSDKDDQTVSP